MDWPSFTLHKVYSSDRQTPDSGATATALLCGVKTNSQLVGLDDSAVVGNCTSQFGAEINCMNDWFEEQGTGPQSITIFLYPSNPKFNDILFKFTKLPFVSSLNAVCGDLG